MAMIAILGLNHLGSSLGLALRQDRAWSHIVGYDETYTMQQEAKRKNAIEIGANSAAEAVQQADVVVLNTTPAKTLSMLGDLAPHFKPGAVVTDTAVTKGEIIRKARQTFDPSVSFVGGHPVVPVQTAAAQPDGALFQRRPWFLMPDEQAGGDAISVVSSMIEVVKAIPHFVHAAEHDSWSAAVEQLPYIAAAALVTTSGRSDAWRDMQQLAGDAFRDASLLVAHEPRLDGNSLETNAPSVLYWLDAYMKHLAAMREQLAARNSGAMNALFEDATAIRTAWGQAERGLFSDDSVATPELPRNIAPIKTLWRRRNP